MSNFRAFAWLVCLKSHKYKVWAQDAATADNMAMEAFNFPRSAIKETRRAPLTPGELAHFVTNSGKETHFFSRCNMKFAGDTMRNYGVRARPVTIQTYSGAAECWELYRKRPVKHGLCASAFFDVQTGAQRFPARDPA